MCDYGNQLAQQLLPEMPRQTDVRSPSADRYLGMGEAPEQQNSGLWQLGIHPLCAIISTHLIVMQAPASLPSSAMR